MHERTLHGPERLRVYHLALATARYVDGLLRGAQCYASLVDQLRRALDSVILNIAEGAAHYSPGRKRYHYQTAHASAGECIAALDRLHDFNPRLDIRRPRQDLQMISRMLIALIRSQEPEK